MGIPGNDAAKAAATDALASLFEASPHAGNGLQPFHPAPNARPDDGDAAEDLEADLRAYAQEAGR